MAKLFRNYNTLEEYEEETNKPVNTVCFIKDAKVIYVDGIRYSYKQLDYLPLAISEAEALNYMGKIIKNAQEVGLIYKPVPTIYWAGDSNTIDISDNTYTADLDKINIDSVEYYQLKLDKDLNNDFYNFNYNDFTNLIFKDVDTSNVTDMYNMFRGCNSLTYLDVSKFDTSNVTDMNYMFYGCNALTSLDLSGWNTSKVTNTAWMFTFCRSFTSLDLSGLDTINVTDMSGMFGNCSALTSLDVSKFDTSNVTDMNGMFEECSSLTSLDLGGWNTSNVNYIGNMFYSCSSLTSLDMSGWDTSNVINMSYMFNNCSALKTIRMVGCSHTTIDKIKSQLSTDGITGCTIITE